MDSAGNDRARRMRFESLDQRWCMAASDGWDGPGRGAATLSYYIETPPANLGVDAAQARATIQSALATWAAVANVKFTETTRPNQLNSLDFRFRRLDGAGGTLAQAYLPADLNRGAIAGDVEFDISETWEVGNGRGSAAFDLLHVAVHEIGHALGLDHSHAAGSVMADTVSANQKFTALAPADVDAVLALYAPTQTASPNGSNNSPGTNTGATTNPTTNSGSGTTNTTPTSTPTTPNQSPTWSAWYWNFGRTFNWRRPRFSAWYVG